MLPLILGVLGGYLIGDSIKDGAISMAKGGKLKAQLIHKEHSVEYYKDGNLINPTKEEKLSWSIFGLPEGVEKKEQSFETVIDEFEGKTKKEIADKADTNTANGKYSYLPPMADTSLSFNDKYAKGGLTPTENLVKELNKLQRDLNSRRLQTYIEGDTSEEAISLRKEREFKLARFNEVLELLRQSEVKLEDGGEVVKSWGVMLFKESKNRNGERIESAFNNLIMKGTLKQVIEDVKEELMGNIIYGTIKDRAGDVLVAKVKQDGTINIYREGYGINKMAKGGLTDDEGNLINLKVGDIVVEYKKPNANQPKKEMGGQGKIILISNAMAKVEYENNYEQFIPLKDLKKVDNKMADGGEIAKSWTVMYFKEGKNRFGEKIESAFNNTRVQGTLKEAIEAVKEELVGNITYATIKDRSIGDVLVAKVKQDGTINIYREGYGIDKMAKGGETGLGDEYYIIVRTPKGLVTKKDFYGMGYNKKEIIDWCEERGWKYNQKGEKLGGQVLAEYEFFLKKPTKYDIQLPKGSMAKGGKVSDVYIFDIYLYSYDDEGLIDGIKEKRKMSVKASNSAKAHDKVKTKYPKPYFVELNRMGRD